MTLKEAFIVQPIRQGDVSLLPQALQRSWKRPTAQEKLPHLVLAEGAKRGHRHRIEQGRAELYQYLGELRLNVYSEVALLVHEEHASIEIPRGAWQVLTQRRYEPSYPDSKTFDMPLLGLRQFPNRVYGSLSQILNDLKKASHIDPINTISAECLQHIADYHQKWEEIATASKPMDQLRLEQAIATFYRANGLKKVPEIQVFSGPQSLQSMDSAQPPGLSIVEKCQQVRQSQRKSNVQDEWAYQIIGSLYFIPFFVAPYLWLTALYPNQLLEILLKGAITICLLSLIKFVSRLLTVLQELYVVVGAPALLTAYLWPTKPKQAIVIGGCYALLLIFRLALFRSLWKWKASMPWQPSVNRLEQQINAQLSDEARSQIEEAFTSALRTQEDYQLNMSAFHQLSHSYESFFNHAEGVALVSQLFWFSRMDFCISELHYNPNSQLWDSLKVIMEECG